MSCTIFYSFLIVAVFIFHSSQASSNTSVSLWWLSGCLWTWASPMLVQPLPSSFGETWDLLLPPHCVKTQLLFGAQLLIRPCKEIILTSKAQSVFVVSSYSAFIQGPNWSFNSQTINSFPSFSPAFRKLCLFVFFFWTLQLSLRNNNGKRRNNSLF